MLYVQPSTPSSRCASPYAVFESTYLSPYASTIDLPQDWYISEDMHNCPFNLDTCDGCDDHNMDDGNDRPSHYSAPSSVADDSLSRPRSVTPCSSIVSIHSPEASKLQLREEFLKLYFPAGYIEQETDFMYSKFLSRESLQSMGPAMDSATNVLYLVQLGTSYSDRRLLGEAQSRYREAVASLNDDLAEPNAILSDDILGAIYILGFCEMYEPLSHGGHTHHRGLRDILLARGPKARYSKFAQLFVYNFRHVVSIMSCFERKRNVFAGNAWKRSAALTDGLMSSLSEQVISLPGLLEKTDFATRRSPLHPGELFSVLMELVGLEKMMQTWLVSWYTSFSKMPYHQEDSSRYHHFQLHCAGAPDIFTKAIRFPSFAYASAQVSYWVCLMQIKQTIYEINNLYQSPIVAKSRETLRSEATEIADNLCQSVAWLSQPRFGFCGAMRALAPLHYAVKWYSGQMDIRKMAWCEKVAKSLAASNSIACLYHEHRPNGYVQPLRAQEHGFDATEGWWKTEKEEYMGS